MKPKLSYTRRWGRLPRASIAMLCAALIVTGSPPCHAQSPDSGADAAGSAVRIPAEQLDSLVAPIALYPDPLLAQVLAASTYPLEIIQLQQWLEKNKGLKDQALVDAAEKQPWDSSVQAMAPLPDLVKRLADDIQWTTDLGNAFLAQQSDLMDAVQRMRQKAQANGNLQTSEQMKVETQVIENKSVVVIEPADPQVVYVPSYNPTVVYGAPPPAYPYPPVYYPPPGYYAAGMALTFGLGVAMGAAWGGGWGSCGWGGDNDININNSNNFNSSRNTVNRGGDRGGSGKWQHNPQHRGGAPYGDRATANKFGGNARGDSMSKRQAGARQQVGRQGGNLASTREAGRGGGRGGGASQGVGGGRAGGPSQGMGGGRAGSPSQGIGGGRAGGPSQGAGSRGASGPNRVGSQDMSRGGGRSDGFGGGRGGYSGSSARAASNRGASSMGSRGGGGRGGGGGGRGGGGGGRGGGGGGRRR